jgi:hypothetical protein
MSVSFRPLAPDEYPAWRSGSLERYAGDIAQNGGYTVEHARKRVEQDFERAAMPLLEAKARRLGDDLIELNVLGGNDVARGLYTSLGHAEVAVYTAKEIA